MSDKSVNKKNKFNFKQKKDCTICSLKEVNHFLCSLDKAFHYVKLYHWLK